jgi:CheY-like chemotaxis protein
MQSVRSARRSVLVVDDEADLRENLAEILEGAGYPVATAAQGADALAFLRRSASLPGLILLDLHMPVMGGSQFRVEQRRDPALARVPVVVVSASLDIEQHVREMDVREAMEKPVDPRRLIEVVARYCA